MNYDVNTLAAVIPAASAIGGLLWRVGSKLVGVSTSLDANTDAIRGLRDELKTERQERIEGDISAHRRIDETFRQWPPPDARSAEE